MRIRSLVSFVVGVSALTLLAGCSDRSGNILGFEKSSPDEFAVVKRAPLTLPPNFGLRPPRPGATRPQEVSARSEAKKSLIRTEAKPQRTRRNVRAEEERRAAGRSGSEVALLKLTGAINVDPEIRDVINREAAGAASPEDTSFVDSLLFWRDKEKKADNFRTVVDAKGESRRLRENEILGKPVTEGVTPTIKRKEAGLLF
ncbi:MAG: DUF3035 domain-containing protein [Alphaproteobacteria bacterium]|nr:DUF3035 domain-containing protein [Alphaproteobacteria bacterium]